MTLKEFFDRYGPTVAVLAVLGLLAVLLPGNAKPGEQNLVATGGANNQFSSGDATTGVTGTEDFGATTGDASVVGGSAGGPTAARSTGTTPGGAAASSPQQQQQQQQQQLQAAIAGLKFGVGPNCRDDKRQKSFSYAAPPCVDWKPGTPNGGATDRGVTADKIKVFRYRGPENAATQAALAGAGASDTREETEKQYQNFTKFFNLHYETYGRQVTLEIFDATGDAGNDEAGRADALELAEKRGAFAVINATPVVAAELARRGVICACTTSLSREFYASLPPYIFSALPTSTEYAIHRAEYVGKRLAGDNAIHAGNPTFKATPRKFGYIWYAGEQGRADPIRKEGRDTFIEELAKYGVKLTAEFSYILDIAKAPDHASAAIAKMKAENVSHLMLSTDPLYPIFFTQEASKQNYDPEWGISGTALTDTTFFGRTYDKRQMQYAFGFSPLYVSWADAESSPGMREYRHVDPGADPSTNGKVAVNVNRSNVSILFAGIQMAGPKLTADTFSQGLFNLPATGGSPARPTLKFTRLDPTWYKDFNEIFWDSTYPGRDEVNKDGVGAYLHVDGGKRYKIGEWPETPPKVFTRDGAVFTSDSPPGGPQATPHHADGHRHDLTKRCLSCP